MRGLTEEDRRYTQSQIAEMQEKLSLAQIEDLISQECMGMQLARQALHRMKKTGLGISFNNAIMVDRAHQKFKKNMKDYG